MPWDARDGGQAEHGPAGQTSTWVLVVSAQSSETRVRQSPELALLEGPAQLAQELPQGDDLGREKWHLAGVVLGPRASGRAGTTLNKGGVGLPHGPLLALWGATSPRGHDRGWESSVPGQNVGTPVWTLRN